MIRRAALVAAAAAALILPATVLSATVAVAYSSPGASFTLANPKPATGVPFKVHASGAKPNEAVTLTMTRKPASVSPGDMSITKAANAKGVVDFEVTLTEDGVWTLVSTSAAGVVLGTQTVTVADDGAVLLAGESAGAGAVEGAVGEAEAGADTGVAEGAAAEADAGTGAGAEAGAGTADQLSDTGFQGMGLAIGGGVFVLVGTGLVLVAKPRKLAPVVPALVRTGR
jgi:hypothetical protein